MATVFETDSEWKQVKIGAGGWATGIDIHKDGTMVTRTDGAGAYLWDGAKWIQLVTAYSMPADTVSAQGVYEIRIAPSDSNVFYMETNGNIYKSVDRGTHWTNTGFSTVFMDANGANRMDGQKMAVDPNDANVVFAGTQQNGLWVTRDGGVSWQKITAVPQGTSVNDSGLTGIVINNSHVYVGTAGSGVYHSADGGHTWHALAGGPVDVSHAAISPSGELYVTGNTDSALWKYVGGSWTKLIPDLVHTVAIDPLNPAHVVAVTPGGSLQESHDAGATWGGWNWNTDLESSDDIPWHEDSGNYMSVGGVVFDPTSPGKLYQSAGVGIWTTVIPDEMRWDTLVRWNSQSAGIENVVPNDIIAPLGGNPVFASWDRAFIQMSDVDSYATAYSGGDFSMGWSVDYASSDPSFLVGLSDWWGTENSGYSTDGGQTWQKFEGLPSFALNSIGGTIAASSPTNFIWAPAAATAPAYTLDGGKNWHAISLPGKTDWSEFHYAYYLKRTTITADRVDDQTFYLYDVSSGVYVTRDGGVNWTKVFDGQVTPWSVWNAKIEAVPGSAGELFFTAGGLDGDPNVAADIAFMHSVDGGATWQAISDVKEVTAFGYGASQEPGGPATVFIVGFVNDEYGVWYSTDDAQSWTQIGRYPMGNLDTITTISGDMDQFGLVYVGLGGNGYAYLSFDDTAVPQQPPASSAPSQTVIFTDAIDDEGVQETVLSGALVNDATPTLRGALSAQLASDQVLLIYRDGQMVGAASTTGTSWKFTDSSAPDGSHIYKAQVENLAGGKGTLCGDFTLIIDASAPAQEVEVVSALDDVGAFTGVLTNGATTDDFSPMVRGKLSSALAQGDIVILFRDGVRAGLATVANGEWSFADTNVAPGAHRYTAQVQDAAGNSGQASSEFVLSIDFMHEINGTVRNDRIAGSVGADLISGLPANLGRLGKGTVDILTGNGGADTFIFGDSRGVFYNDGSAKSAGLGDYALVTDFGLDDRLQLRGSIDDYFQSRQTIGGATGTGIFYDSNNNGVLDSRDEFVALIQNHGPLDSSAFFFV